MTTTITMPSLGESVAEGEIGKWLVAEGQRVDKDQPLVEVLTDKADSEIPATSAGVVTKIFAREGAMVAVGDKLCEIDPAAQAGDAPVPVGSAEKSVPPTARPSGASAGAATAGVAVDAPTSPAVRKLAREKGIDLATVKGSGDGGRITREDVMSATSGSPAPAEVRAAVPPPRAPAPVPTESAAARGAGGPSGAFRLPPYTPAEGDEVVPFNRRRRIIADHMVYSKLTAPHVVTFAECDLHRVSRVRDAHKKELEKAGLSLTFLGFVAAATCRALREVRELNARVLDDAYVLLREVNLGIAVDAPDGLVVPVIKRADELGIRGLARAIDDLAKKARDGNLAPDDLAGKTFTISNPGRKGNLVGGAIISQPNVGILRMGEIQKRVVVVEHDGEDFMAIHPVMYMGLSYDHRIVDGAAANAFLYRIVELLEAGEFEI